MEIHTIKSEKEYEEALTSIDILIDAPEGSVDAEKLELLSILVEDYENKHHKIDIPDPIEAIKQRVDQLGLTRKDLEISIGPRSRVSEIFNGKRQLTLSMIRRLNRNLNIPAEILIQPYNKKVG